MAYQPMIFGYQLLGDSHMVKLAMKLGDQLHWFQPESIGLCISGQSIQGLTRRLQNTSVISEKVILMIGNNDYQREVDNKTIQIHFLNLIEYLLYRVRKLVILTVVPSPEFIDWEAYRLRSLGFNNWLLSVNWWEIMRLDDPGRVTVLDVSSPFVNYHDGIREEYFEQLNRHTGIGPDGLCLNSHGMTVLLDILERKYHPSY